MSKYIIKNCTSYCEFEKEYTCGAETKELFCEDNTDCVLKCIKSKLDYLKCYINNDDSANLSKMNEIIDSMVQLLDIQEVE